MKKSLRRALIISAVLGSFSNLQAMSTKAEKFFSILEKKPESEFLFDRFYDLYMLEATAADLEKLFDDKYNETKDSVYLQLKAALFEEESETGKALELYDQLVDDKSSAFLIYKRGFLKFSELDFKGAVKDLELASSKSPSEKLRIKISKLLGKIYIRENEVEKGLAIWLKMVQELDDENLAEDVLELMIGEGLYDQAQKQIENFIKSAKTNHRKIALKLRQGIVRGKIRTIN